MGSQRPRQLQSSGWLQEGWVPGDSARLGPESRDPEVLISGYIITGTPPGVEQGSVLTVVS